MREQTLNLRLLLPACASLHSVQLRLRPTECHILAGSAQHIRVSIAVRAPDSPGPGRMMANRLPATKNYRRLQNVAQYLNFQAHHVLHIWAQQLIGPFGPMKNGMAPAHTVPMPECQFQLHTADGGHKTALFSRVSAQLVAQFGGVHIWQSSRTPFRCLNGTLVA